MELPDEQVQKPQEKLGRLKYRIDYDFGLNNVSFKRIVSKIYLRNSKLEQKLIIVHTFFYLNLFFF